MKFLILKLIRAYQGLSRSGIQTPFFFGAFSGCRSWPTCSEFAHDAVAKHGVVTGGILAVRRVLQCRPRTASFTSHQ